MPSLGFVGAPTMQLQTCQIDCQRVCNAARLAWLSMMCQALHTLSPFFMMSTNVVSCRKLMQELRRKRRLLLPDGKGQSLRAWAGPFPTYRQHAAIRIIGAIANRITSSEAQDTWLQIQVALQWCLPRHYNLCLHRGMHAEENLLLLHGWSDMQDQAPQLCYRKPVK